MCEQPVPLEVAHPLDTRYATCATVTVVSENLNTHTIGAFYEAFRPNRPVLT